MKKQTIAAALAAALVGSAFLGTGMQTEAAQWVQDGTGWWYQEDNGSYPAGTWSYINDAWYYFDGSGYMLTGWQWIGGTWYYLSIEGRGSLLRRPMQMMFEPLRRLGACLRRSSRG